MNKPVLISGIQPTGRLHLGNYLGALKNFVDLQNSGKYQCHFFIADYHSLTEDFDPKEKSKQIKSLTADFLAAGLDPKKSVIFLQSQVPPSTELAWILDTITPFGELSRMTQFKEKSGAQKAAPQEGRASPSIAGRENVNVGLFTYPVLMAADILLYDAKFVPVGEDQLQHLELTRTLARKFNSKFGQTFMEPKALLTATPRLMSLDDPSKKMSKSRPAGCLFIDDSPEEIEQKIKTAVTDSGNEVKYDIKNKSGISNMISIMAGLSGKSVQDVEKAFAGMNYGEFKHSLSDYVADYFAKFRNKKSALIGLLSRGSASDRGNPESSLRGAQRRGNLSKLKKILNSGSKKASKVAQKKIEEVKEKIGLTF